MKLLPLLVCAGCYNVDGLSLEFDAGAADLAVPAHTDDLAGPHDLSAAGDASAVVTWSAVQSPVSANLRALCSDGNVLYVAGASSTILRIAADDSFTQEDPGPGYNLRGAAAAAGDVWVVGDDGTFLQRQSTGWTVVGGGGGETLYAAFLLGAGDLYTVGSGGSFFHNQAPEDTGALLALFSVYARSATDVFAVGEGGTIVHRGSDAGAPWAPLKTGTSADLHGLAGNSTTLYAAGAAGTLLRSEDSSSFSAESSTSSADLFAVWLVGDEAFVVGAQGTILHRKGGAWSVEHSGGPALRAVVGRSNTDVWAVGDNGTILHSQP